MTFENISKLFTNRASVLTATDVAYGIERFLQTKFTSQHVQCRSDGTLSTITIRVGSPALAQAVAVYEYDIRLYAKQQLGCTIQTICVLL